jgi:hypothetical protein
VSNGLRIWLSMSLRASNASGPSTGRAAKYQATDSRVEPRPYSSRRARSTPELRLYASAMFAAIDPSARYSWDPIGRAIRVRSRIRASSQPVWTAYNANRYAVTLQRASARSVSGAPACHASNDRCGSTGQSCCWPSSPPRHLRVSGGGVCPPSAIRHPIRGAAKPFRWFCALRVPDAPPARRRAGTPHRRAASARRSRPT